MRRQAGFTLVEIAIVLVIIGLLLGGVLKGQELIESAKVKRIGQDFRAISIAVMTYQDKYRALPGDDKNAANRWEKACKPSGSTQGDGLIDGNSNKPGDSEAGCVWNHLRLAGLLTGEGNEAPRAEDGGDFSVVSQGPGSTAAVEKIPGTLIVCAQRVRARHVIPLDAMLDDGDPASGSMRATKYVADNTAAGAAATAMEVTTNDTDTYNVCMGF